MGQTFQRAHKPRKETDGYADLRKEIRGKQTKNIAKHRNAVYQYLDDADDDEQDFVHGDKTED